MPFASVSSSSSSANGITDSTGPKISSCATFMSLRTPLITVGSRKNPPSNPSTDGLAAADRDVGALLARRVDVAADARAVRARRSAAPSGSRDRGPSPAGSRPPAPRRGRRAPRRPAPRTNRREPATHACPWLKKIPPNAPLAAASRSASANTMFGLLPPSSSVTRFSPSTAVRMISLPVAVCPVNATLRTPGVAHERRADVGPADHDVHDAGREPGLVDQLHQPQRATAAPAPTA